MTPATTAPKTPTMLTIYAATKYHSEIARALDREDRLRELVSIVDYTEQRPIPSADSLIVRGDAICPVLDWYDASPPYLLAEEIDLTDEYLLGLVFAKLDNYERVYFYLADVNPVLNHELDVVNRLRHGLTIDPGDLASGLGSYDEYRLMHNHAIVQHYGTEAADPERTQFYYVEALDLAPTGEHRAFTAYHFAALLTDMGAQDDAARVLAVGLASAESPEAKAALRFARAQARLATADPQSGPTDLAPIKEDLWAALEAFEQQGRHLAAARALLEAGTVAQYDASWSEGLGYLDRAVASLTDAGVPALLGDAYLRRGTLLLAWAQAGNPQFYRKAAESLTKAARAFPRDEAPGVHADIQQRLGTTYAEMPDEEAKRAIWAAMSSSAFQEALGLLDAEQAPGLYATACVHYGNALLKYPEAKLTDNVEKALYHYQRALDLQPAGEVPLRRSQTLLNYLEAQWHLGMEEDTLEKTRFSDMRARAMEVLSISPDPELVAHAEEHLRRLELLRVAYAEA